ncbi:hypothetical protein [uncultured Jatrophihabitans sp.]|uniref:hypothetical protein n=1 Tax=uncultured Jatrophihabitans sp. TaxID=1610747 RepID=UPI0035CA67D4
MPTTKHRAGGVLLNRNVAQNVTAALIAVVVVALTLFGSLNDLWGWVRGSAQAIGTLAGIYLGAHLQLGDQRRAAQGAATTSIVNLGALAKSVNALLTSLEAHKTRLLNSPPKTNDSFQQASQALIEGVDSHCRGLLAQAEAAALAWEPFIDRNDQAVREIGAAPDDAEREPHD